VGKYQFEIRGIEQYDWTRGALNKRSKGGWAKRAKEYVEHEEHIRSSKRSGAGQARGMQININQTN